MGQRMDWRDISSAPRDGTIIEVMDPDCGSATMRWNPAGFNALVSKNPGGGIWECPGEG